jgi:N-acetylmuramoyl-L-alanine amidase
MSRFRPKSQIKKLVIHCADTPNGRPFTAADIDQWHAEKGYIRREPRGGSTALMHIGYHWVIRVSGAVEVGRGIEETGAHAGRLHNADSLAVCLIGRDRFAPAQWQMLREQFIGLRKQFPLLEAEGHRDLPGVPPRTCPGFSVAAWLAGELEPLDGHILEDAS